MTGRIGVTVWPRSNPSDFRPADSRCVLSHNCCRRSGSDWTMSSAAMTAATQAGVGLALKISARELCLR